MAEYQLADALLCPNQAKVTGLLSSNDWNQVTDSMTLPPS